MSKDKALPEVDELITAAEIEPKRAAPKFSSDYAPVVDVLYKKGMSWPEIISWLHERGATFSAGALKTGYSNWKKQQKH